MSKRIRSTLTQLNSSMAPLILPADKPTVKRAKIFKVNDVVVFRKKESLVAHRIIYQSTTKDFFITKGDNQLKSDGKIMPSQILGKVENVKRDNRIINLFHLYLTQSSEYFRQLNTINSQLNKKGIAYIFLKGLPTHLHYTKTVPKRLYLDADILIRKKDIKKVSEVLNKLGFKSSEAKLFERQVKDISQISFIKKTSSFPVVIDLHLEPAIGFTKVRHLNELLPKESQTFVNYLFRNIKIITINKIRFPVLKIEAFFIYLLLHLYHHNFNGAYRYDLVDKLARKGSVNWNEVKNTIIKYRFRNLVYPGVLLLKRYYHTPFPKSFIQNIKPAISTIVVSRLIVSLLNPFNSRTRAQEGIIRFILLFLLSPDTLNKKLAIIAHKETKRFVYPTIKSFFRSP